MLGAHHTGHAWRRGRPSRLVITLLRLLTRHHSRDHLYWRDKLTGWLPATPQTRRVRPSEDLTVDQNANEREAEEESDGRVLIVHGRHLRLLTGNTVQTDELHTPRT